MSRSNPYKKKRRYASKTLLVFGEGLDEEVFLKHLRKIYSQNKGVVITIRKGKGGDAESIVVDADKILGSFDRKIVIIDNDKPQNEMNSARNEAKKRNIELLENTPCLEALLLCILGEKVGGRNSQYCKKQFELKYLNKDKRSEQNEYDKLFPQKLLDHMKSKISELENLISIMSGE